MKNEEEKITFMYQRKDNNEITKLSDQDRFHIRVISIIKMITEKDEISINLIMTRKCKERFIIDQKNNQVIYEIVLIKEKGGKNLA